MVLCTLKLIPILFKGSFTSRISTPIYKVHSLLCLRLCKLKLHIHILHLLISVAVDLFTSRCTINPDYRRDNGRPPAITVIRISTLERWISIRKAFELDVHFIYALNEFLIVAKNYIIDFFLLLYSNREIYYFVSMVYWYEKKFIITLCTK